MSIVKNVALNNLKVGCLFEISNDIMIWDWKFGYKKAFKIHITKSTSCVIKNWIKTTIFDKNLKSEVSFQGAVPANSSQKSIYDVPICEPSSPKKIKYILTDYGTRSLS